jgi:Protein of unknown function (DUF982)
VLRQCKTIESFFTATSNSKPAVLLWGKEHIFRNPLQGDSVNSVIPVGFRLEWEFAVHVGYGPDTKAIAGPRQALRYLQEDFGIRSGQPYWTAVADCNSALRYRCEVEIARTSFIVAYSDYVVRGDRD